MNKRYELSTKSLLYAVICLRKRGIYGAAVSIPRRGDRAYGAFVANAEQELSEKGLGTLDFDGNFCLEEAFGRLVGACADCRDVLGLSLMREHARRVCTLYLGAGGLAVYRPDGICELYAVEDPCKTVAELLALPAGEGSLTEVVVDTDHLENKSLSALVESGCGETAAKLILDGFAGAGGYAHLVHTKNRVREGELLLLYGAEGIYSARAEYTETQELLRMTPVSAEIVLRLIDRSVSKEGV